MEKGISKLCSRCNQDLQCRADSIKDCACSQVELSAECLEFLKKTNFDCLCNNCLLEVNRLVLKADSLPSKAIVNVHYYMENGLFVFTELNHIQRGHCCHSNCRHCAYGFVG